MSATVGGRSFLSETGWGRSTISGKIGERSVLLATGGKQSALLATGEIGLLDEMVVFFVGVVKVLSSSFQLSLKIDADTEELIEVMNAMSSMDACKVLSFASRSSRTCRRFVLALIVIPSEIDSEFV